MIRPENWQPSDGLTLEPNALRAATEQVRCLALTAGPGAGKTEMLAQRADFLLRTGVCKYPNRILAISFKVDASKNLKDRIRRRCGVDLSARFDSYTFHAFAKRIIDRFRTKLTGLDALDADYKIGDRRVLRKQIQFNDLVPLAIQIFETSQAARNAVRKTYSDVFLDEFQDCTNIQYELVKLAFGYTPIRLTAVGDTKQRIMAWAGALEGIFATFAADFNALPLNMYRNFRSKPKLLRMQNHIIKTMDPESAMAEDQIIGNDGDIDVCEFDTSVEEAIYLAEQINHLIHEEGVPISEIAVLVRQQPDLYAELLMAELGNRNIPYRNEQQMQDLSIEPVARLIVDYLLSLYGSREPAAWQRLMSQLTFNSDISNLDDVRLDWQMFIQTNRRSATFLLQIVDNGWPSAWNLVEQLLNKYGQSNLMSLSSDYESSERLNEVIAETKLRIEEQFAIEGELVKALNKFSDDQVVRILTIHKSKGLEFDSVILLGVENQTFWGNQEENRCTFFVGMSRAKRKLILTYARTRTKPVVHNGRWDAARTPQEEFLGYAYTYS